MNALLSALLLLGCHISSADPDPPVPSFPVPGVLHSSHYDRVRTDSVLGTALDGTMLPALSAPGEHTARAASFVSAHDAAITQWRAAQARGEATAPPLPPTEGPGPEAILTDFNRVSTDAIRSWLRTEAATIAAGSAGAETRIAQLQALSEVAGQSLPWDVPAAGTARIEVANMARTIQEGSQ
jgi:hypothetical protein